MRIRATMWIVAIMGIGAQAKDALNEQLPVVAVYIQCSFGSTLILDSAKYAASKMLAEAGVEINWRAGQPTAHAGEWPIVIELTGETPRNLLPRAFAYARVYEGVHIRIFGDRIEQMGCRRLANQLLAHVMVHEITHILQGIDRHSQDGVMKARWTAADIEKMAYTPLPFEPRDILLIRAGLAHSARMKDPAHKKSAQLSLDGPRGSQAVSNIWHTTQDSARTGHE